MPLNLPPLLLLPTLLAATGTLVIPCSQDAFLPGPCAVGREIVHAIGRGALSLVLYNKAALLFSHSLLEPHTA